MHLRTKRNNGYEPFAGITFQISSSAIAWRECESAFTPDYAKYRRASYNDDRLWERSLYTVAIQRIK